LYACLYRPPAGHPSAASVCTLASIAEQFSPRYECRRDDLVSIDVSGLERLLGPAQTIGEELRRTAAACGIRAHVAVAGTRMAAMVLALAQPGLTVIARGEEAEALAPIAIGTLEKIDDDDRAQSSQRDLDRKNSAASAVSVFKRWGLKTLGELAALPAADLTARLGRQALAWQTIARGQDIWPPVPTLAEERFESSLELEWPIEDLEPLSFVLTRLLEPLSTRLERRDRGAAVLHVLLRLVTREICARRLELPSPIRDVRTLRTLALLDLEAHPPSGGIDRVTIVIDPTPGRVLQHTLFTRAHPTPEQLSTLLARLGALMGTDRFGAPSTVDSYRPGAFTMAPFATDHETSNRRERRERRENSSQSPANSAVSALTVVPALESESRRESRIPNPESRRESRIPNPESRREPRRESRIPNPESPLVSALRRCRYPVPARVAVADGRPVRVTTDRRGFAGGTVTRCAGPWRTSGEWWAGEAGRADKAGRSGEAGRPGESDRSDRSAHPPYRTHQTRQASWNRDEWDVSLSDGAVYRVFRDRDRDNWFIDAVVD
jgi:nucleotidyltransferase/DNA polymerase involved in DNA repair